MGLLEQVSQQGVAAAQTYAAASEQACLVVNGVSSGTPRKAIRTIGIVGAGTMGGGISMVFLNAGFEVRIIETAEHALERGLGTIRKNYQRSVDRGRISEDDVAERLGRLLPGLDLRALSDCDLIIEAIFEDMSQKIELFRKLDALAKPEAILASNTSFLDVNTMAAATQRPDHVIGLHFFSPANVMKLLEIVRGDETAADVLATCIDLAQQVGKIPVTVGVCTGFVGNRMLFPRQEQAFRLLAEGAMPWAIDKALTDFGFAMGPFQMADLAGLDIGWKEEASDPDFIMHALCLMGRRGQKTQAGFYDYGPDRAARPSGVVEDLVRKLATKLGSARFADIGADDIVARCLFPMVNEGARILDEGMAARASDIDVIWRRGFGWPADRGGPMFWGEQVGLGALAASLGEWALDSQPALLPAQGLKTAVEHGGWPAWDAVLTSEPGHRKQC